MNFPRVTELAFQYENEVCSSCAEFINDQILLSVNSQYWHSHCLRCSQCSIQLDTHPTCYVKAETLYCKSCYNRYDALKNLSILECVALVSLVRSSPKLSHSSNNLCSLKAKVFVIVVRKNKMKEQCSI